jgi:hypothetical protein
LFSSVEAVQESGYYELTRNWRIGCGLAERLGASHFVLVNLGPPRLAESAGAFAASIQQSASRQFVHRTWNDLLGLAEPLPDWLRAFARQRGLHRR